MTTATQNVYPKAFRFLALTLFGSLVVAGVALNHQLGTMADRRFAKSNQDTEASVSFRWHPDLYRMLSFGQIPSSVDWLLIRFLTDTNLSKIDNKTDKTETELSRVLNLATEIDPAFFSLYTAGSNFLAVARNDRFGALRLILKGDRFLRERYPNYPEKFRETHWGSPWRIRMILGYIYLVEFQDMKNASEVYRELGEMRDVPVFIKSLAASTQTVEGQFRVAINTLEVIRAWYREDPVMLEELTRKRGYLLLGRALYEWNRDFPKVTANRKGEPLAERFARFRIERKIPDRDAFGGKIFLTETGLIDTETKGATIFGIDIRQGIPSIDGVRNES